jgi:hypothetical protein
MNEQLIGDLFAEATRRMTGSSSREFSQKFAELIVRECIDCADIVGQVNIASGYPNSTAHHVKQKIREHFGVEE